MARTTLPRFTKARFALHEFEATYRDVCTGQMLDLLYEKSTPIRELQYLEMIRLTTGRFLEGAVAVGALLSGCPPAKLAALRKYGRNAGVALQIYDDVFDLVPLVTHDKEFANDIKRRKQRLPVIHFRSTCSRAERRDLSALWSKQTITDGEARQIVERMVERGSIAYCLGRARAFADRARREVLKIGWNSKILGGFVDLIQEDDAALTASLRIRCGSTY